MCVYVLCLFVVFVYPSDEFSDLSRGGLDHWEAAEALLHHLCNERVVQNLLPLQNGKSSMCQV